MKLHKNNKYGDLAKIFRIAVLSLAILLGCSSYLINDPVEAEGSYSVENYTNDNETVDPTPSEPLEDENTIKFKRLTADEEEIAIQKLGIIDYDEVLTYGECRSANYYIDGEPKIIFGRVFRAAEEDWFLFQDIFSGEDLFIYQTTNKDHLSVTWTGYDTKSIEFTAIHPYFSDKECELRFVDMMPLATNFLMECGLDFENEDNVKYRLEILPAVTYIDDELSMRELAHIYLNLIPESLWVTAEDLESANEKAA